MMWFVPQAPKFYTSSSKHKSNGFCGFLIIWYEARRLDKPNMQQQEKSVWKRRTSLLVMYQRRTLHREIVINPLNAELNPICHLLALLGVHHFLHVSRIKVKWKLYHLNSTAWLDHPDWLFFYSLYLCYCSQVKKLWDTKISHISLVRSWLNFHMNNVQSSCTSTSQV